MNQHKYEPFPELRELMFQLLRATEEKKNQRNRILNIFIPRLNNPYFFLEEKIK